MADYFELKKRISQPQPSSGSSSKTDYFSLKQRVNPVIESNRRIAQQQEEQRKLQEQNRAAEEAQRALQEQNSYQNEQQNRAWYNPMKYIQGAKSALGFETRDVLPEIPNAPKLYQAIRGSQKVQQEQMTGIGNLWNQKSQWSSEVAQPAAGKFGEGVAKLVLPAITPEQQRIKQEISAGAGKNLLQLASGTGKLIAKAATSRYNLLNPAASLMRNEETRNKVNSFIDNNGILNYEPTYKTEYEKTGGNIAEIGSWFIPVTKIGKIGKIEKALAELLFHLKH